MKTCHLVILLCYKNMNAFYEFDNDIWTFMKRLNYPKQIVFIGLG